MPKLIRKHFLLLTACALVIAFQIFESTQKMWFDHLVVDYGFYHFVVNGFWQNHSFGILWQNSYLPGSLFFFLIPGLIFFPTNGNFQAFVNAFIAVNIVLLIAHLFIYSKQSSRSVVSFLLILVFAGPILLFRHEFFPSILTLVSLLLWQKEKYAKSAFILGLATATKFYPGFILPYFLILLFKKFGLKKFLPILAAFALGALTLIVPFILLGSPISELTKAVTFNSDKPVHIESLWANLLTSYNWIPGKADQNGIFGLNMAFVPIPIWFFNTFWFIPMAFFYLFLFFKTTKASVLKMEIPFMIVLLFLIFSKVITPQYIFWAVLILPMINWHTKEKLKAIMLFLTLLIVSFTAYVYPLHYNDLLWSFYVNQTHREVFNILFARNLLMIILFLISFKAISSDKN